MENELEKTHFPQKGESVKLPAGSLWGDLRAESGHGCGIEWLLLYENDPLSLRTMSQLLYVKIIIQTPEGREAAENGQAKIIHLCNLRSFETALFSRAFALAMTIWDDEHSS